MGIERGERDRGDIELMDKVGELIPSFNPCSRAILSSYRTY